MMGVDMRSGLNGNGCSNCPVNKSGCDAMYRGSRCSAYRARAGVDFDPKTNIELLHDAGEDEAREMLIDYFSQWAGCGDSYIYDLTRVKEAFAIGTMSFDDFVEWEESRIAELVDELMAWLKEPANKK